MIKLCIFDMDGLLIDSERQMWMKSMDIAAKEQGRIMTEEFHITFMGASLSEVAVMLKKEYGEDFDPDLFFNRCVEINAEIMKQGIPLCKGAKELLDYCKENGIKMCIGTSTARIGTMNLLKIDGILDYFDGIVCGDEIKHGKPAPDIYLECFNKFNFDKSEALIFEDGQAGAYAAIATGIRLVLVPDLAYLNEEVRSKAYKVLDSLDKTIELIKEENETTTSI